MENEYREGDTIYILLKKTQAEGVLNDWLEGRWECDLKVHKSQKTKGCVVVETTSLMWMSRIIRWYGYEKVSYKHQK